MKLYTVDFETYFDPDYTLKKLTTEAYVRDPRYKTHCCCIKPFGHPAMTFTHEQLRLLPPGTFKDCAFIAQKAHFDGLILMHHYGIRPAFWYDTLSMAKLLYPHLPSHSLEAMAQMYGLQSKTVPYEEFVGVRDVKGFLYEKLVRGCEDDCAITEEVFKRFIPYVPKDEQRLIDMTVRMFTEPTLRLDRQRMVNYIENMRIKKEQLMQELGVTKKDLGSNEKFASLLRAEGIDPVPTKQGKNGEIYAFAKNDDGMRAMLEHPNERIALLCEARLEAKSTLGETRAKRLLGMHDRTGTLAVYLNYCGAHTTRWSGGDKMNWQNFTRIDFGPDGKPLEGLNQRGAIRLSIMAPDGHSVVVGDCSQIECRLLNYVAGQWDVLEKFRNKEDLYSQLATRFYGFEVTKANKAERGTGKQLMLSCGYGAGGPTICTTAKLGIYGPPVMLTPDQGLAARNLYRSAHPQVVALWKEADQVLYALFMGHEYNWRGLGWVKDKRLHLPNGTYIDYTNLGYSEDGNDYYVRKRGGRSKMYGAKLVENWVQALARIVIAEAMLKTGERYRVALTTHDELVAVVPQAQATEALDFILTTLRTPPVWCPGIPLDAEGGYDVRYSK